MEHQGTGDMVSVVCLYVSTAVASTFDGLMRMLVGGVSCNAASNFEYSSLPRMAIMEFMKSSGRVIVWVKWPEWLLFAHKINEGVSVCVLLVLSVLFSPYFLPL